MRKFLATIMAIIIAYGLLGGAFILLKNKTTLFDKKSSSSISQEDSSSGSSNSSIDSGSSGSSIDSGSNSTNEEDSTTITLDRHEYYTIIESLNTAQDTININNEEINRLNGEITRLEEIISVSSSSGCSVVKNEDNTYLNVDIIFSEDSQMGYISLSSQEDITLSKVQAENLYKILNKELDYSYYLEFELVENYTFMWEQGNFSKDVNTSCSLAYSLEMDLSGNDLANIPDNNLYFMVNMDYDLDTNQCYILLQLSYC